MICDRKRLSEVRICMSKDLQFRACEEIDRRACRRDEVVMPPMRGGVKSSHVRHRHCERDAQAIQVRAIAQLDRFAALRNDLGYFGRLMS